MDIQQAAGAGAGGGVLSAIFTWLGFRDKFHRVEKDIDEIKGGTVWRETCGATHKAVDDKLDSLKDDVGEMNRKLDQLIARGK